MLLLPCGCAIAATFTGNIVAKLGVALSCALLLWIATTLHHPKGVGWILIAFLLSAVGDGFLSYRAGRESYFIAGITFFFLAHASFLTFALYHGRMRPWVLGGLLFVYLPYYVLYLRPSTSSLALSLSVLLYLLISCCTLSVATGTRLPPFTKWSFVAGIVALVFSDTLISLNEFLGWREANFLILPTYYLAHICVTAAAIACATRPGPSEAEA